MVMPTEVLGATMIARTEDGGYLVYLSQDVFHSEMRPTGEHRFAWELQGCSFVVGYGPTIADAFVAAQQSWDSANGPEGLPWTQAELGA